MIKGRYLVYTDLLLDDMCALDYLARKYKYDRHFDIVIVNSESIAGNKYASDKIRDRSDAKNLARVIVPSSHAYVDTGWDASRMSGPYERVYCMCPFTQLNKDFDFVVGKNTQVYLMGGVKDYGYSHECVGEGEWNAEQDLDAFYSVMHRLHDENYKYVLCTAPELKQFYECFEYSGYESKYLTNYVSRMQEMGEDIYCPDLQFVYTIENRKGMLAHLMYHTAHASDAWVYPVYGRRVADIASVEQYDCRTKQRSFDSAMKTLICCDMIPEFGSLDVKSKLIVKLAAVLSMLHGEQDRKSHMITTSSILADWGFEDIKSDVCWLVEHFRDLLIFTNAYQLEGYSCKARVNISTNNINRVIWKNKRLLIKGIPFRVLQAMYYEEYPMLGHVSDVTKEEVDQYRDGIVELGDPPSKLFYQRLFCVTKAIIFASSDVRNEEGELIYSRAYSLRRMDCLYEKLFSILTGKELLKMKIMY